jgi:hypothetical protein
MQPTPGKSLRRNHWHEIAVVEIVRIIAIASGCYGFNVTNRANQVSDYYYVQVGFASPVNKRITR